MINKGIKLIIFSLFIFLSTTAFAQFENCSNGIDDDGDGKIDCFDSNCSNSPFCQSFETQCSDGIDNDGDGLPDCIDPDCYYSGVCPTEMDCNNGVDDDGDGFFDYYDGDCLNDPDNPNTYITNIADCEVKPQGNVFEIEPEWQSDARTSGVYSVPIVADLDGDGISEIISTNDQTRTITIINGKDGTTIRNAVLPSSLFAYPAVADVDNDGFGEIFIFDNSGRLYAYNHDLTPFWTGSQQAPLSTGLIANIADFNQDGNPEVYYTNEIRDANSGQLIIKGSHNQGIKDQQWDVHLARMSVAVNILPDNYCPDCSGLELVLGNTIYAVDIDNKQLTPVLKMDDAGTKTLVNPVGGFTYNTTDVYRGKKAQFGVQNFSTTSVVDFNEDGNMDVVLSGTLNDETTGPTMIFFWDITNNTVKARLITRPYSKIPSALMGNFKDVHGGGCNATDGECTWKRGMGTLNVANIDNDPELEVTFMSGSSLYALDQNLNEEWANHDDFWETSSGFTGTTVFDFDGDGASEVVYRDEIDLYIIDGTTGIPLNSKISGTFCSSQTQAEYPVVADVDADGETEIIVSCGCLENTRTSLKTSNTRDCGYIRTYKAANNNYWVPARKLWNQYVYFNVNINDDLSIPRFQQYHHLSFAQKCNLLGADIPKFSLNKFYNQSPIISYCGNLAFPAPNLDFADNPIQVEAPTCPDERFQVRLRFMNTGDQTAFKDIPISFYADDPEQSYLDTEANPYLETIYINIPGGLQVNQLVDTTVWVNGKPGAFTLYTSLNDIGPFDLNGSSLSNEVFYPLDSLNGTIRECDGTPSVIHIDVNPYPFNTTAVLIKDNDNCPGAYNSNGAITAHVAGDTVGYVFRWYEGSTTSGSPEFIGATQKGLSGGKYTVVATHIVAQCTGNTSTITIRDLSAPPVIGAEVLSQQRSCDMSNPSGELTAFVLQGGNKITNGYNFFWYKGQNTVIPARAGYTGGPSVDQLTAGVYRVVVEQITTGCTATMDIEIKEVLVDPVISLVSKSDQTVCDPSNYDGQASVAVGGNTSNYDFYWYNGNVSSPDTTSTKIIAKNSIITGLDKGTYTAFAVDRITRCISQPLKVKILDKTWNPVVNTKVLNPQQACDLSLANGSMQASVDESSKGGSSAVISGYTFDWYLGTFTTSNLPATPTASGSTVNGLIEGKYTLVTRNAVTACQTISYTTLSSQKTKPTLDPATVTHTDNCTDPWGSDIIVTADGGKTSTDGYTFQWRQISTNTILAETSHILGNIAPGEYGIKVINPLGCTSLNEMKVTVKDEGPKPVVSLLSVPNSSCDAAQPNGMLIAKDFVGNAADYTFEWFQTNLSSPLTATSDTVRLLPQGKYILRLTDNLTQCFQLAYANIGSQPGVQPSLDTLYTNATTDCRPAFANGEVQFYLPTGFAHLPPDFTQDRTYTFELYSGSTVSGSPVQTNADGLFTGLNNEEYTAIVRDDYNLCISAPMTIEIPKAPGIDITLDYSTPSSACASSDGALQISVSSPNNNSGSDPGYSFDWYFRQAGDPIPGVIDPGTLVNETAFVSERTDLPSGYYTIEVYDNFSNCVETFQYFLPNADPPQITSNGINGSLTCIPGTGSIAFRVVSPTINLDNYTVYIYAGNSIDPGNEIQPGRILAASQDESDVFNGLEAGRYTIALQENFGANCFSTVQNFTVPDNTPETEITVDISPDFTCNTNGTGSLSISDVKQNGSSQSLSDFSYEWREGVGTSGTLVGTGLNATNLASGNYTVIVTDNASGDGQGCSYTKTVFLNNLPKDLAIHDYTTKSNEICSGNDGEITITDITENGTSVSVGDYTLTLQDDAGNVATTSGGSGQPGNPFSGLAEGTYYVLAENIATGCSILSPAIIIDTETYEPVISLVDDFPDFSCAGGQFTGMLEIDAISPADNNTTDFDFIWYRGNVVDPSNQLAVANIDPSNPAKAINLEAGEYIVEVIDHAGLSNGCRQTSIFEVLPAEREITLTLNGIDPTYCVPANGEINVQTITESYIFNGASVVTSTNITDYAYTLLDADLNVLVGNDPDGKFSGLDEGTYFVQAQNTLTDNCLSDPVGFTLESLCIPPVVTVNLDNPQFSNNPDPSSWTGSISINVMESVDNPVDSASNSFTYTYEVYKTDASGNPVGTVLNTGNSSTATMLDSGNYVIVIKNNVTGATSTSSFYLPKVNISPEFMAEGNPQTVCYPDGNTTLAGITFKEIPDDPSKYTIFIYENSDLSNITDSVIVASMGDILFEGLGQGSYYLQAKHNTYLLLSDIYEVEIANISQVPLIDLDVNNLYPQISCQPELLATGKLTVIASEKNGASDDYQYQWYRGNTTLAENIITGATKASLDNLPSGFYTVEVFNTRTRCTATKTLYVEDRIEIPIVIAKSTASSVCDPALANGSVSATVQSGNYLMNWYEGNTIAGLPAYTGNSWGGLMPGTYTVVATDLITGTCSSLPVTVQVEDASLLPEVAIETIADNSACDPSLSNGVLRASLPYSESEYEFTWFDDEDNIIGNASTISSLAEGSYSLEVKYKPTGCTSTAQTEIKLKPVQYPEPTVSISSHMTNCTYPDGSATALLYEENDAFIFTWYNASGEVLPEENVVINENDFSSSAINLAAGTYFVEAFDLTTGCNAPQARIIIEDQSYVAEHKIEVSPASCEVINGSIKILPQEDMTIRNVSWTHVYTSQTFETNYQLNDAPSGEYEYRITWNNGCTSVGSTILPADINVFNGVSPNGDGDNDIFHIDCIDQFPNNLIKIFNRAGALVYEAKGYDNSSIFFDGLGNRGLYIGNKELPDGTYFYVIEKNNGDKAVTGYLELFR